MTVESVEPINHKYDFDQGIDEKEDTLSEEQIITPYDAARIQVDAHTMTIFQVMRKIAMDEINLQPDFQRNVVWDPIRQSRLIESILIRIPLPPFYLDARDDNEWLVVDGLQRLTTLNWFYQKKELRLNNLEFLGEQLNGKTFDELPRPFQRTIEDTHLQLYVIKPDTPAEAKFTIFYRINTGGMVLSSQEIRHCLFQGKSTVFLKKLAESKSFLEATTSSINTKRMDDRECVLRFCAFYLKPFSEYSQPDYNKFLGETMSMINKMDDGELDRLEQSFLRAMETAKKVFGKYAFRKMYVIGAYRYPINKSLFEAWSVCLEKFEESALLPRGEKIVERFIHAMNTDTDYERSVTQGTGGVSRVHMRFNKTMEIIREALS